MGKTRLEAFSDGVIAIVITIMVLELHVPEGATPASLVPLLPVFCSYALSFAYVGIYWNNHHHMLHAARHVSGRVLWANLHLLFWLSLFPFATAWMGDHPREPWPVALYGFVLLLAACAYYVLQLAIIAADGEGSILRKAIGSDWKGKLSPVTYLLAIGAAFVAPVVSQALYVAVALLWLVPDSRIERKLAHHGGAPPPDPPSAGGVNPRPRE